MYLKQLMRQQRGHKCGHSLIDPPGFYKPTFDKPHPNQGSGSRRLDSSQGNLSPDVDSSSGGTIRLVPEVPEPRSGSMKTTSETQTGMKDIISIWTHRRQCSSKLLRNPSKKCAPSPDQDPGQRISRSTGLPRDLGPGLRVTHVF